VAQSLIAAGALLNLFNSGGSTALAIAAGAGNGPLVALLLQSGADPNAVEADGSTPLMTGAENGSVPIVKALLSKGADPNLARSDGLTGVSRGGGKGVACVCGSGWVNPDDDGNGERARPYSQGAPF
jgi:ankyrin repeat protein